jgi:hypothetical protein
MVWAPQAPLSEPSPVESGCAVTNYLLPQAAVSATGIVGLEYLLTHNPFAALAGRLKASVLDQKSLGYKIPDSV